MDVENAIVCLQRITECLDPKFRGKFFADGGTLLGLVRNGGIIAGDGDIDIAMRIEDYDPEVLECLLGAGFSLRKKKAPSKKG